MIRSSMVPPDDAGIHLLDRKRKRGRIPQVAPAWERMGFDMISPVHHPQQDHAKLACIAEEGDNLLTELHAVAL